MTPRPMDYDQALEYMSGLLRFGIKFGLDRFAELCRRMGNPQDSLRVIHVGGTNGKGSTCTFITSILRAAGYRIGTYLSPYVYDVRERIQIDGEPISEEDFASLMSEIAPHLEAVGTTDLGEGTEFEAKTLMAFLHFARKNVDFSVIEVGMGGRYDCTNVVTPLVSVITNVSLDHTERLGETISKIAWDKAGIAKPGAPLVTAANAEIGNREQGTGNSSGRPPWRPSAPQAPDRVAGNDKAWRTIHSTARDQGVETIWRVMRRGCEPDADSPTADHIVFFDGKDGHVTIELPSLITHHSSLITQRIGPVTLRLAGDFQLINAATAAAAIAAIPHSAFRPAPSAPMAGTAGCHYIQQDSAFRIPHSAFEEGLASAYLPGRLEVLRRNPTVVIDAAHNPDGTRKLAESIPKLFKYRRLIIVIGMLTTHSAEEVVAILAPIADEIIATKSQWEKARPASEIAETARKVNPNVRIVEPVPAAVRAALDSASEDDLVLITGSFYTIGEVDRNAIQEGNRNLCG